MNLCEILQVAGGSVTGTEHSRLGRNNQDAWAVRLDPGRCVAVVADGCGSGRFSEVGARLGAHLLVESLFRELGELFPRSAEGSPDASRASTGEESGGTHPTRSHLTSGREGNGLLPSTEGEGGMGRSGAARTQLTEAVSRPIPPGGLTEAGVRDLLERARLDLLQQLAGLTRAMGSNPAATVGDCFLFTVVGFFATPTLAGLFHCGDGILGWNGAITRLEAEDNAPAYLGYGLLANPRLGMNGEDRGQTGVGRQLESGAAQVRDRAIGATDQVRNGMPGEMGQMSGSEPMEAVIPLPKGLGRTSLRLQLDRCGPLDEFRHAVLGTDGLGDLLAAKDRCFPGGEERIGPIDRLWTDDRLFANPDGLRRLLARANLGGQRPDWAAGRVVKTSGLLTDDTTVIVIRTAGGGRR